VAVAEIYRVEGMYNPNDVFLVDSTRYKAQWAHMVSQYQNSFWTLINFIDL
jgi:hypothetical protein